MHLKNPALQVPKNRTQLGPAPYMSLSEAKRTEKRSTGGSGANMENTLHIYRRKINLACSPYTSSFSVAYDAH